LPSLRAINSYRGKKISGHHRLAIIDKTVSKYHQTDSSGKAPVSYLPNNAPRKKYTPTVFQPLNVHSKYSHVYLSVIQLISGRISRTRL